MGNKLCSFNTISEEKTIYENFFIEKKSDSFFGDNINPIPEKERLEDCGKFNNIPSPNEYIQPDILKTKSFRHSNTSNMDESYIIEKEDMYKKKNNINKINKAIKKYLLNKTEKRVLTENQKLSIEKRITLNIVNTFQLNYKYIGNITNEQKEGFGIKKFSDKSIFRGIFHHNLPNGYGKYNFSNGNSFKGIFENGNANNYGIFNFPSIGLIFEGYWKNDIQNEIGIEKWSNNSYYKGEYDYGKKNGLGIYKWENGNYYFGEWKNNYLFGYGIYKMKNKKYQGEFLMNYMNGYGEMIYEDKNIYIGFWFNNKKIGFGIEYLFDKKIIFLGFWKDNKKFGYGKLMSQSENQEKIIFGFWKDNNLKIVIEKNDFINKLINCGYDSYFNYFNKSYDEIEKKGLLILNSV